MIEIDLMNKFDFWLVKWVVVPLAIILLSGLVLSLLNNERKCQELAEKLGFVSGTYIYGRNNGDCLCVGRIMPDGSIDEEKSIKLDF